MVLTKFDLSAIKQVVKGEIKPLEKSLVNLEKGQSGLRSDVVSLKKGQGKIFRELTKWTKFFDRDYIKLKRRVVKIEDKLEMAAPEF